MINSFLNIFIILSIPKIINMVQVDFGNLILEENESYYSLHKQNLIFESDIPNITEIDWIGYELINQIFSIQSFQEAKLVKITFLNSFHFTQELAHCICQLLKSNESYYIVCIDGVFIKKGNEELKILTNAKTYKISLMFDYIYECDRMFQDITNQIIVFCSNSKQFELSIINILNQTITTLTQSDIQFQNNCEIRCINEQNVLYLLIYKCQNWMILLVRNYGYQIVLNNSLLKIHNIDIEIDIVNQIQFCFSPLKKNVYLISNNWYYVFELNGENLFLQSSHQYEVDKINLLIFENCQISAIVSEVEQQDFVELKADSKEILLKKDYFQECYSTSQYIILRHNNELMTLLSSQFKQTYMINSSKIEIIHQLSNQQFFVSLPELFYQIDQQTNKAYFYELGKYKLMLKPQKKYVYIFYQYNYFSNTENVQVFHFRVLYINNQLYQDQKKFVPYEHKIYNRCQTYGSLQIDKLQQNTPSQIGNYQLKKNENNLFITIQDEELFFEKFVKLKFYSIKQIIWMSELVESKFQNVIILTSQNELICLDQNLKVLFKKDINKEEIFHMNGNVVFVQLNFDLIFLVLCSNSKEDFKIIQLNDQVAKVNQFVSFLILELKNKQIVVFDLYTTQLTYLNNNLLSFGMPIFYIQSKIQIFIQYQNLLIYQKNQFKYQLFPFENVTIIDVEIQISLVKIKTINSELNLLKTFYINDDQIYEENEYYLKNFRLSNQKYMSFSSKILILAGYYFNEKVLQIIYYDNYVKILNIKFTNQFQFSYFKGKIYYYNQKNQLMIFNVKTLNLTVNNLIKQNQYLEKYELEFFTKYNQNQNIFTITKEIKLIFLNQCYKIFSIKNLLYSDESIKLPLREIFMGPIDQITLNNQNSSTIQIPFIFQHTYSTCISINDKQCIQIKNFPKIDFIYFQCILDDNQRLIYCQSYSEDSLHILIKQFISYEDQIIVNLIQSNNQYYFQRYKYYNSSQYIEEIFYSNLKIFDFENASFIQIDFKYQKNFILISLLSTNSFNRSQYFLFVNNTVLHHSSDDYFTDLCFIQNTSDWYLLQQYRQYENTQIIYQFQIITNENMKINLKYQFKIDQQVMQFFIENHLIEMHSMWNDFHQLFVELQECHKNQNDIKFITFSRFLEFSCAIETTFNIINSQINFQILKIIRNPSHLYDFQIVNFDTSILLIYELEKKNYYFYDLSDYQPMYDYIYKTTELDIELIRINTTHYIFKQTNPDRYYIGLIGYQFHEQMQMNDSILIASNHVSAGQIQIINQKNDDQLKQNFFCYENLFYGILLLCGIYLFRRWKLKQVKQSNQMIVKT